MSLPSVSERGFSWKSPSSWIGSFQKFFDVTSDEVVDRLKGAANPIRASNSGDGDSLLAKPDLYGPFWIMTTAIIAMTGAANIERMFLDSTRTSPDYSLMWTAAWCVYGSILVLPVFVYSFTLFSAPSLGEYKVNYSHLLCVYGYSGVSLIPAVLACTVPWLSLQRVVLAAGAANSGLFIHQKLWNLMSPAPSTLRLFTVVTAIACQAICFLAYYFLFLV